MRLIYQWPSLRTGGALVTSLHATLSLDSRSGKGSGHASLTPRPLVPTPHRRLTLAGRFSLDHFELKSPPLQLHNAESQQLTGKA